jgi:hypothetical protein
MEVVCCVGTTFGRNYMGGWNCLRQLRDDLIHRLQQIPFWSALTVSPASSGTAPACEVEVF